MSELVEQVSFWESKYQAAEYRWDLGEPAPPLVHFFEQGNAPKVGQVGVLGCGRGHDAIFLAQRGFGVTAIDFAPGAIASTVALAQEKEVEVRGLVANIFDLPASYQHQFDYLFEHTCFCAIAPERRVDYVQLAATILKPQGIFYGIFFTHSRDGGPPFGSTVEMIRDLFSPHFNILTLEAIAHSTPSRQGEEHWAIFQNANSNLKCNRF
jgi:SAM-dependent methyltransferase